MIAQYRRILARGDAIAESIDSQANASGREQLKRKAAALRAARVRILRILRRLPLTEDEARELIERAETASQEIQEE